MFSIKILLTIRLVWLLSCTPRSYNGAFSDPTFCFFTNAPLHKLHFLQQTLLSACDFIKFPSRDTTVFFLHFWDPSNVTT
uniref:Putative secreted protein n=1 Tax=Anopheles triannulatus TaxID=58253 RepID=A0A2M4B7U0_9DIPT